MPKPPPLARSAWWMAGAWVCQIRLIWPPTPTSPTTSATTMGEIMTNGTIGTIASFPDGIGKTTELTGCSVAVKPLVFELKSKWHFKLDDSRTIWPVKEGPKFAWACLEQLPTSKTLGLDKHEPKYVYLLPKRVTWAFSLKGPNPTFLFWKAILSCATHLPACSPHLERSQDTHLLPFSFTSTISPFPKQRDFLI